MKNQKGISLIKLIIIIAVIIVGIILIFQMFKPRDGILSVDDAEKQYQNALNQKEQAEKEYQDALKNATDSKTRLEQLEKGY
jgi:flagellar basal body-associated protein FliL